MTNPSPIGHDEDVREWVRKGLEELERLAGLSERAYARWRRIYERVHFLLGVPATILAAAASISAFSDAPANWVAGLLAGASAALVGLQTLVRPDQKARFNQQQQFVMARVAFEASAVRSTLSRGSPIDQDQTRLIALQERYFTARGEAAS